MKPSDINEGLLDKGLEVIYDKLKLLNHKAYEMMIRFRNANNIEDETHWKNNQHFIKDAMMIIDDGNVDHLTKTDFKRLNDMWKVCKDINV